MELLPRRHGIAAGLVDPTRTTPYPLRRFTPLRAAGTWRLVSAQAMPQPHGDAQPLEVLVYCGEGAGYNSSRNTLAAVQRHLARGIQARFLTTEELLEGAWPQRCLLLVMPGGADLPYCKHLNGRGNQLIKGFVAAGGSYLGICAGAYYACQRVEFEPGTALEVVGDRELGFFPGTARGAAYPGFDYLTERGACAAPLRFRETPYGVPCVPTPAAAAAARAVTTDTAGTTAATVELQSGAGVLGGGHGQAAPFAVPRLGRSHLMFPGGGAEGPGAGSAAAGRDVGRLGGAPAESETQAVGGTGAALQHVMASPCTAAGAAGDGGGGGGGINCADGASVRQGLSESGAAEGQPEVERRGGGAAGCRTTSSSGRRGGRDGDSDGTFNNRRLRGGAQDSGCSSSGRSSGGGGDRSLTDVGEYNGSLRHRRRRPEFHPRAHTNDDGGGCDNGTGCDFGGAHSGWVYCKDYSNGGPVFVPSPPPPVAAEEGAVPLSTPSGTDTGGEDHGAGSTLASSVSYETLAVYPGLGNSLAAVRCTVGAGVAVLCGTHPEMPYEALVGSALLYETAHAQHAAALGAELAVWERQRRQFWQVLLLACCTAAGPAATAAPPASTSRVTVSETVEAAKGSRPPQIVLEVAGRV